MEDITLQGDIMSDLERDPSVGVAEIGVSVKDGIVTLGGRVHSLTEKWAAERDAGRVDGVKAVANEIEVVLPGDESKRHSDSDIARAAVKALKSNPSVPKNRIKVTVSNGWVKLHGSVRRLYQRDAAERAVRALIGVKGIDNGITVKRRLSATVIQGNIQKALERRAGLDAKNIKVEVDGDKVTLRGEVSSWLEHDEAGEIAWSAPGVANVDNQILVGSSIV